MTQFTLMLQSMSSGGKEDVLLTSVGLYTVKGGRRAAGEAGVVVSQD